MKKIFLFLIIFFASFAFSIAQGIIRGKITDENGEAAIGAAIMRKSNMTFGAIADLEGNYSIKIADSTRDTLIISWVGYEKMFEPIRLVNGEILIKNFNFSLAKSKVIKEVEVTAKAVKAKDYYMEKFKMNSSVTVDYISSETMKKTGDVNVSAAVARVPGVSTTSNGFVSVRGIGDRYVKTIINGSRIPTLDPFTNNIKLDIFPASLVDNIIITKTASPDMPGDWAGAYISVETKDYPDQLTLNEETSFGYNSQSTFKDVLSSQHSSTDWLGYDNGFREHSHNDFVQANLNPNQYQQFVGLGLGDYYKSLGVTSNTPWNDTYYKLGLVQLGLLAPALINDPVAFANAQNLYNNGPYKVQAFNVINAGAVKTGQSFPNNWNTTTKKAPLDISQSFSIGNQIKLFGKPLGIMAGFRYGSSTIYDPVSFVQRPYPVSGLIESSKVQQISKETNGWSALVNLAYKFTPNNTVAFLFMPNITGVNNVRNATDTINYVKTLSQFYEQRKQLVYQFKSEHYFPGSKIKIETNASYTQGKSSAPDFKILEYNISNSTVIDPLNKPADRYFRYLSDNLFDSRVSAEMPLARKPGKSRKIKIGGAYQNDKQRSDQYNYHLNAGNGSTDQSQNIDQQLSLDNFGISNGTIPWYYSQDETPINHTFGRSRTTSGFAMLDYAIFTSLRISCGLRVEHSKTYTDVDKYDSLNYVPNDPRRYYKAGYPVANPGKLDEISFLPSANIIYKLRNSEETPINLRFNFSQTVARPSIRELSDVAMFDYELQGLVTGNPNLKIVKIKNYDLRAESYFKNGDNVSMSLFYKDFKDHIELEQSDSYYWQNVDKSHVTGLEFEGKKSITKHFEFRANLTFVNSITTFVRTRLETIGSTTTTYYEDTIKRPMFGQAPYILNGIVSYKADSIGLNVSISYNIQGPRLVIASNNKSIPDVYELQRHLLDLKVTKKLSKHFSASITVRNILNAPIKRAYKYPDGFSLIYDKYRYGTIYVFSLLYKL